MNWKLKIQVPPSFLIPLLLLLLLLVLMMQHVTEMEVELASALDKLLSAQTHIQGLLFLLLNVVFFFDCP